MPAAAAPQKEKSPALGSCPPSPLDKTALAAQQKIGTLPTPLLTRVTRSSAVAEIPRDASCH